MTGLTSRIITIFSEEIKQLITMLLNIQTELLICQPPLHLNHRNPALYDVPRGDC